MAHFKSLLPVLESNVCTVQYLFMYLNEKQVNDILCLLYCCNVVVKSTGGQHTCLLICLFSLNLFVVEIHNLKHVLL